MGPLIGYKLRKMEVSGASVFGTLERPVHAMNLEDYVRVIQSCYHDCLVVAVDASVGNREHIGYLSSWKGALKPDSASARSFRQWGIFLSPELWAAAAAMIR